MPSWSENSSVTPNFDIVWKKSAAKELQGTEHTFRLRAFQGHIGMQSPRNGRLPGNYCVLQDINCPIAFLEPVIWS